MFYFLVCMSVLLAWVNAVAGQEPVTSYAPSSSVNCPDISNDPLVRVFSPQNQTLNPAEQAFVELKQSKAVIEAWSNWLGNGSDIGYDFSAFQGHLPKVGLALGGEGYRGAQYGAGVLSGFDARNVSARAAGTGGLLQVASYLSATSGSSWLAGSLFLNDWPTIRDAVYGNGNDLSGWLLDIDLVSPDGVDLADENNQAFFGSLLASVEAKANTGINTSLTDLWARMVSYHFLNGTTRGNFFTNDTAHGAGQLWSQIPDSPSYTNYTMPYPIIVADSRPARSNMTTTVPLSSIVYEITPHEFGSWDPNLSAMVNITYVGTDITNGQSTNSSACVIGFDDVGFIMGTSASFFNEVLNLQNTPPTIQGFDSSDGAAILYALNRLHTDVRTVVVDAAIWPNPFFNISPSTFEDSNSDWLELLDGTSNSESVPLGNLFVKVRALDTIVAIDASADNMTYNWPNGTSLLTTSSRISTILSSSHQSFPPIPSNSVEFITTGVNQRPTFFGCSPTQNPPEYPLLIYIPNSPPLTGDNPSTNTDTFQLTYTSMFTQVFLDQVHANTVGGFSPNSNSPDPNWGKCLQCAAIDRSRLKLNPVLSRSNICQQCFQQYCYDPDAPPSQSELPNRQYSFVNPDPQGMDEVEDFIKDHKADLIGGVLAVVVVIAGILGFIFWNRKRREKNARYFRVDELREEDEPWKYYDSTTDYELPELRELPT